MPKHLSPAPPELRPVGRRFRGERKVRLGDVTPEGRLRLDALTRYTQDVSDDDTCDAGLATDTGWVVRRTAVEIRHPATMAEQLSFTTHCSGLGRRWAERRLTVIGDLGGRYDVATLWICVDATTGRPRPLTEQFLEIYGEATEGRQVSARLGHPRPTPEVDRQPWPLRVVDFDTLNHVNNAAYWAVVEEVLDRDRPDGPYRASIEYRDGLSPGCRVTILSAAVGAAQGLWWTTDDGAVAASGLIEPLPDRDSA